MTPLDEALALLRDCEDNAAIGEPDWGVIEQRIRALRTRIANESAAAQDNKARQVSTDALDKAPSSGSLPNTSGPASAAPTPLTDEHTYTVPQYDDLQVVEGLTEVVPADFARDLERKLAEARAQGQKPAQAVDRED